MTAARRQQPWASNLNFFNTVTISALAAVKMLIHAKRGSPKPTAGQGEWYEVMGLMLGHFYDRTLCVTGAFALPVDASEVECSMNESSQIYMVDNVKLPLPGRQPGSRVYWLVP